MANDEADRDHRDVRNHVLFEVATEVAHRGMFALIFCARHLRQKRGSLANGRVQLGASIP